MAAMQHFCRHHGSKKLAIWILGGGVPKNYTLQGEPLLDQILSVPTTGFDIDVQFCVDPVDNGALSSCPAGEGHTWGKVSVEAVETGSVYVHTDVTAVFPWLTHALFSAGAKRPPMRLMDRMERCHRLPRPGRRPAEEEAHGHDRLEPGHREAADEGRSTRWLILPCAEDRTDGAEGLRTPGAARARGPDPPS